MINDYVHFDPMSAFIYKPDDGGANYNSFLVQAAPS